jgi:hypothetical protein
MLRHLPRKIRAMGALPHQNTPDFESAIKESKDHLRRTNQNDKEFQMLSRQVARNWLMRELVVVTIDILLR